MALNIDKCSSITFHKNLWSLCNETTPLMTSSLSEPLKLRTWVRSSSRHWTGTVRCKHQSTTCTRALLTLGLLHCLAVLSANLWSLRLHDIAHFWDHTYEYCSVLWSPQQFYFRLELERVQHWFLHLVETRQGLQMIYCSSGWGCFSTFAVGIGTCYIMMKLSSLVFPNFIRTMTEGHTPTITSWTLLTLFWSYRPVSFRSMAHILIIHCANRLKFSPKSCLYLLRKHITARQVAVSHNRWDFRLSGLF